MAFASAQDAPTVALSGRVLSGDGAAVVGAIVTLRGNTDERTTHTDENGRFTLPRLARGSYAVHVVASGYEPLSSQTIGVRSATEFLTLILARSSSSLITIGRVQTSGGDAISTSSAPSTTIDSQRYAQLGYSRVSDVLQDDISTTLVHPLGGSTTLPTSVALRGPDPTETLIDVDGHQVNNGNTGDFDLSLLDPADYGSIELVKGISPSSLVGPDTIDGAINIRTLDATENAHGLLRLTGGSFNSFGETVQATGTYDRLGYAVSLHRTTTAGEVDQPIFDRTAGTTAQVGSAVDGSTALGKLRFAFGRRGGGYAEFSFHDQSQFRDFSAALSSVPSADAATPPATSPLEVLDGLEGTALAAHNSGYGLDVRTSLGTPDANGVARTSALFRHYTSFVSESVTGPGAATSPYLYGTRDVVGDDSLELDHQFSHATLAFQFGIRNENLATDFMNGVVNDQSVARRAGEDLSTHRFLFDAAPAASNGSGVSQLGLAQTQRSAVLRYTYDPTASLHVTAATYYSNYSIFGTSLDPRFGLTFDPDSRSVVRFSVGTTFQAPQLPELHVPSVLPQSVGGYVSTGNPNLKPDYATEYGLGAEHIFETGPRRTDLSVDLYRVNLRAPASIYLPQLNPNCGAISAGGDGTACPLSYPVNAGAAVYQGVELSGERRIADFTTLRAGYAVRSAYLTSVPSDVADGTLVVGEQSLGLPLQKATLSVRRAPPRGFGYAADLSYEGLYNELNQPQFALISAGMSYRRHELELQLYVTNLTNVFDQRFTRRGAGVPYGGLSGPIATDSYALQGTALNFSLTRRF